MFTGNGLTAYRTKTAGLEVPPDLTPLAKDGRYQPQTGTVTASAMASGVRSTVAAPVASTVARAKQRSILPVRWS
mgnify:CR=1 FL=1